AATTKDGIPPIPPAQAPTSPAALTQGAVGVAGDRRAPAAEVTLHGPRPAENRLVPAASSGGASTSTAATPASASFEQLQEQLRLRGVVWQDLRMVDRDKWDFICAIPDPSQKNVRRTYEVKGAVGPFGLAAMQAT